MRRTARLALPCVPVSQDRPAAGPGRWAGSGGDAERGAMRSFVGRLGLQGVTVGLGDRFPQASPRRNRDPLQAEPSGTSPCRIPLVVTAGFHCNAPMMSTGLGKRSPMQGRRTPPTGPGPRPASLENREHATPCKPSRPTQGRVAPRSSRRTTTSGLMGLCLGRRWLLVAGRRARCRMCGCRPLLGCLRASSPG